MNLKITLAKCMHPILHGKHMQIAENRLLIVEQQPNL